jgi:3-oxoacyl-[acyl-carrier protein] reductase
MNNNLKSKVAIVTGGGRDIGRAAAIKLGQAGAKVVVNYNNSVAAADETVKLIKQSGGEALAIQADVTRQKDIDRLIAETQSAFGKTIHILVNNAGGLLGRKTLIEADEEFFDAVMRLNMTSVFLMTKAIAPLMTEGGAIVNLSTLAARNGGGDGSGAYAASKGAVLSFTRSMAKELAPCRIRVNCVSPGLINTTFHNTFTKPEVRQRIAAATPINREGNAEEVADAILFLAGDMSSFITGESLEINGGAYFV